MSVTQPGNPYNAGVDANNYPSLTVLSGTAGTADSAGTAEIFAVGGNPKTGAVYMEPTAIPGFNLPVYDYIAATYPDGTTEVFSYKAGGSSGTAVGTLTVVYTDSTKGSVSTVTKTG